MVAEVLYADKILTPEEFEKLQDRSLSGRPRWLLIALRRTGKHGLKSFHRALQKTGGVATQHREMLPVLVAKGVCVFVHVSVLTCVCLMHQCMHVRMCACKHVNVIFCVCMCKHVRMYACTHFTVIYSVCVCVCVCM